MKILKRAELKVTQAEAVTCIAKAIICDLWQADLTFILVHSQRVLKILYVAVTDLAHLVLGLFT